MSEGFFSRFHFLSPLCVCVLFNLLWFSNLIFSMPFPFFLLISVTRNITKSSSDPVGGMNLDMRWFISLPTQKSITRWYQTTKKILHKSSHVSLKIYMFESERCSDGVTLTGDGVTQSQLPLVDGEQVIRNFPHCISLLLLSISLIIHVFILTNKKKSIAKNIRQVPGAHGLRVLLATPSVGSGLQIWNLLFFIPSVVSHY